MADDRGVLTIYSKLYLYNNLLRHKIKRTGQTTEKLNCDNNEYEYVDQLINSCYFRMI